MSVDSPFRPPATLLDVLNGSRRPLVIAHLSPDGDAIGSLLALGGILYRLGKDPVLVCQDPVPTNLQFLPHYDRIMTTPVDEVDVVVALDSSDPSRLGEVYQQGRYGRLPLVVIDHHVTNTFFGTVHWVEPSACATAELVYYLGELLLAPYNGPDWMANELATYILTGIVTDTRGFRTNSTNARVMELVARLVAAGAPLTTITEQVLESRTFDLIRLWGRVLQTVRLDDGVISVINTQALRRDLGGLVRPESLVSFLLGAQEAYIAAVFTELPDGQVECSFRARPGHDVSRLALELGGGGHALAAGCTVKGDIEAVRRTLVERLQRC
jgi:phosphoesterase RecJ-like protein